MASAPREGGNAEALAIRAGRHSRDAPEQAPEERRVLVADPPAHLVDRIVGAFESSLGVLDAQALHLTGRVTPAFVQDRFMRVVLDL